MQSGTSGDSQVWSWTVIVGFRIYMKLFVQLTRKAGKAGRDHRVAKAFNKYLIYLWICGYLL